MTQGPHSRPDDRFSGRAWGQSSWLDHSLNTGGGGRWGRGDDSRSKQVDDARPPLRLGWLIFVVLMVVLLYNAAPLIEEARYAYRRGGLRAESEDATARLEKMGELNINDTSLVFPLVVQRVQPSVVQIETFQRAQTTDEAPLSMPRRPRLVGQGAGVVFDAAGYILTNYHVVRDSARVRVRLSDGRRIEQAEVAGTDPATDLALLKVEAEGLIPAVWGDSDKLLTGEWVLAVGNPFGLERTVTAGIVSAKHRRDIVQSRDVRYEDFLQTDAAVNPGNSGGPLVNRQGEVVGITTAIVGETFKGVGFAIPSELARTVYEGLKRKDGVVPRGWLGVGLDDLTERQAQRLGVPQEGAWVTGVPGEPARTAGIQVDDVIVGWNGEKIEGYKHLSLHIARTAPNSKVTVAIRRRDQQLDVEVTLGRREAEGIAGGKSPSGK